MLLRIWMGLLWDEGMNAKTLGGIPGVQLGFGGMLIQIPSFGMLVTLYIKISNCFIRAVLLKMDTKPVII